MQKYADQITFETYNKNAQAWKEYNSSSNYDQFYIEKPAIYSIIPSIKGKNILCIGCGTGEECAYLKKKGAKEVVGIDYAPNMIKIARKNYGDVIFKVMNLNNLDFKNNKFDLVFSSLALHYIDNIDRVFKKINQILRPKGYFVFSILHPLHIASESIELKSKKMRIMGYERDSSYKRYVIYGDYLTERKVIGKKLFKDRKVNVYHKPISNIINSAINSNFSIKEVLEPKPRITLKRHDANLYKLRVKVPSFIVFNLQNIKPKKNQI